MQLLQNDGTLVQPSLVVLRHASDGHVIASHESVPLHVTLHAHELPHVTPRHDWAPEQITSHGPVPHTTFWQDCFAEHSTLQLVPGWQLTPFRQALSVLQRMSHA